jgi:hypothetical protein
MYNKESCRGCGKYLIPSATCNTCKEYVYWICNNCKGIEEVFHSHNYCRLTFSKDLDSYKSIIDKSALFWCALEVWY